MSPDAIIIGGSHRSALCTVRSLGRRGLKVWVVDCEQTTIASRSRHCERSLVSPSPATESEAFADFVVSLSETHPEAVFIPTLEVTLLPLHQHRDRLKGHWALPPPEAVALAFDKERTVALARDLGIPVPPTWTIADLDAHPRGDWAPPVPAVVKPSSTVTWGRGGGAYLKVTHTPTRDDLREVLARCRKEDIPALVQPYFPGLGVGVFGLFDRGEPKMLFQHERLRDVDPRGSGSSYRRSRPLDPVLVGHATRLMGAMGWHGLAMVELRVARDGTPYLMEVNGRPWGSMQLAVFAGVDFPYGLYLLARGEPVPEVTTFDPDIHARWLAGDLKHLKAVLRGRPEGWTGPFPGRLSTLVRMAVPYRPGMRYDHLALDDPWPPAVELADLVKEEVLPPLQKRLRQRLASRSEEPADLPSEAAPPASPAVPSVGPLATLRRKRGLEIALAGPDGSGKSSLAERLRDRLPHPTTIIYMGEKDYETRLMRWVRQRREEARPFAGELPTGKVPSRYVTFLATHGEWLHRRLRGHWLARQGWVVIYDRHPAEATRLDAGATSRLNNAAARGYDWPVDLTLFLTGDDEVFFRRKPEWTLEELAERHASLRAKLDRLGVRYQTIDSAVQDAETVFAIARDAILEALGRRAPELGARQPDRGGLGDAA